MKKTLLLITTIFLIASSAIVQAQPKTYNVFDFDISGVKLGMTYQEAEEVITKFYQARSTPFKLVHESKKIHPITQKPENTWFTLTFDDDTKIIVESEFDIEKSRMVIRAVFYTIPYTNVNFKNLLNASIQKYGPISTSRFFLESQQYSWCTTVLSTGYCEPYGNNASLSLDEKNQSLISLDTRLVLSTHKYGEAIKAYQEARKPPRPAF